MRAHTDSWDVPVLAANYVESHGDVTDLGTNSPLIGWADHHCDLDGEHDTTPAWNLVFGGRADPAQRFAADLVFMFR